jgi:hypothetical protein
MPLSTEDRVALSEVRRTSRHPTALHEMLHYLYFDAEPRALAVAADLRRRGFSAEVDVSPMGDGTFQVVATHRVILTADAVSELRGAFERIAEEAKGGYAGWDVAVPSLTSP